MLLPEEDSRRCGRGVVRDGRDTERSRPDRAVRSSFSTPSVVVTSQLLESLIEQGGYVHPLFRTPWAEESADGLGPPLPGPALLLLMGGLVERSGQLDHAEAMVGLEEVRFRHMVRAGARISVEVELLEARVTASGRCLERYLWRALTEHDQEAAEATAVMLVRGRSSECVEQS